MKKYSTEQRKYISEAEYDLEQQRKLKKRDKCRGGRPHDWVEVLPWGVEAGPTYQGIPEPYYEAEKAIREFEEKKYQELEAIGIIVRRYKGHMHRMKEWRHWMCSVCMKKDYTEKAPTK